MQARLSKINNLVARVEDDRRLSRRAQVDWVKLEASNNNVPQLDMEYLETVACGRYQIGLAVYMVEHLTTVGDYEVWVYQHSTSLLRGQIRSHHKSQAKYNVWID